MLIFVTYLFNIKVISVCSSIVIIIIVVVKVKISLDGPVAKLDEEDFTAAIFVGLAPLLLGVAHIDTPFFEKRLSLQKF